MHKYQNTKLKHPPLHVQNQFPQKFSENVKLNNINLTN
jgi:hypothetical protein